MTDRADLPARLTEALLPCPFCGSQLVHHAPGQKGHQIWVHPEGVDCIARTLGIHSADLERIAAWNRRSAIASRQAVADDLREANRHNLQEIADGAYGDGPLVRGRARDELAKLNSAPAAPVRDETRAADERGWLVEMQINNEPWWWAIDLPNEENWTKDSLKALRFGRREDAESFIRDAGWTEVVATEYMWSDPSPRALSQTSKPEAPAGTLTEKMPTTPQHRITPHIYAKPVASPAEGEAVAVRWQRAMTERLHNRNMPDFSLPASEFPDYRTGGGGTLVAPGTAQKCIRQDCDCFDMWHCSRPEIRTASPDREAATREAVIEARDDWQAMMDRASAIRATSNARHAEEIARAEALEQRAHELAKQSGDLGYLS